MSRLKISDNDTMKGDNAMSIKSSDKFPVDYIEPTFQHASMYVYRINPVRSSKPII